jgi:hypothetical protein
MWLASDVAKISGSLSQPLRHRAEGGASQCSPSVKATPSSLPVSVQESAQMRTVILLSAVFLTGTAYAAQLSGPNNCGTPDEPKACKHVATHKATVPTHKAAATTPKANEPQQSPKL